MSQLSQKLRADGGFSGPGNDRNPFAGQVEEEEVEAAGNRLRVDCKVPIVGLRCAGMRKVYKSQKRN